MEELARQEAEMVSKAVRFIEQRAGQPVSFLTDYQSYLGAAKGPVWATYKACHLTGSVIRGAELRLLNTKDKKEANNPALSALLQKPNLWDSMGDLLYMMTYHIKLTGSAYILLEDMNGAKPGSLHLLLPQYVKPVPDELNRVSGYKYEVNGRSIDMPPERVIALRNPAPDSFISGVGDAQGGETLLNQALAASSIANTFYSNGALPSGVLTRKEDPNSAEEWEAYKKKFNAEYAGKANVGKVAFLTGEWSWLKLGLSAAEMQQLESSKWSVEQIFALHGVPASVAGLTAASNYATAVQEDRTFRRYTCWPLVQLICQALNHRLLPLFGDYVISPGMDGMVDVEALVKEYMPLVNAGAMTLNELRAKVGLPTLPDPLLDLHYIDRNRIPLELAGTQTGTL